MKCNRTGAGLAVGIAISGCACFVSPGLAQHVHEAHPPGAHGHDPNTPGQPNGHWYRYLLEPGWTTPSSVQLVETEELVYRATRENRRCVPAEVSIARTYQRTHTVTVNASMTIGAEVETTLSAFAQELRVTASAEVELGGGWSGTNSVTYGTTDTTMLPACQWLDFKQYIIRGEATGHMEYADHRLICRNNQTGREVVHFCNLQSITGEATGYYGTRGVWDGGLVEGCDPDPNDTRCEGGRLPASLPGPVHGGER